MLEDSTSPMKSIDHKNRSLLSGPHLLGTLFVFAGIVSIIGSQIMEGSESQERPIIIGIVGLVLGFIILNSYSGIQVDLNGNRFIKYQKWSGFRKGNWITLPDISEVKMDSITTSNTNTPNGISPTLSGEITTYRISLINTQGTEALVFEEPKKSKAESLEVALKEGLCLK